MTFNPGSPTVFDILKVSSSDGMFAPYSAVNAGGATYFCSTQGFKAIPPGGAPVPVGKEKFDRFFFADVDQANPQLIIGAADPKGAAMYNLFTHGEAKMSEGGSITEGIGLGRVTPIIEKIKVDKAYLIPDEEAVPIIFDLLEHEGLCVGGSTGINVAGAIRLARELGPDHTIVTILCDGGARYQSKLFNPEFLRGKGLPVPHWLT